MTHDDFHNQMNAYLAGGLTHGERAAFAAHAASCPACAAGLEQAEAADRELGDLFATARPDHAFEDRVITRLRAARRPLRPTPLHPMVRRAAVGVAAAILLGGVGFTVTRGEHGGSPLFSFLGRMPGDDGAGQEIASIRRHNRGASASNLRQIGEAVRVYASDFTSPAEMARQFTWEASQAARPAPARPGQQGQQATGFLWYENKNPSAALGVQPNARPEDEVTRLSAVGAEVAAPAGGVNVDASRFAVTATDAKALGGQPATVATGVTRELAVTELDKAAKVPAGGGEAVDARGYYRAPASADALGDGVTAGKPVTFHDYYGAAVPGQPGAAVANNGAAPATEGKFQPGDLYSYRERQNNQQPADEYDMILLPTDDPGGKLKDNSPDGTQHWGKAPGGGGAAGSGGGAGGGVVAGGLYAAGGAQGLEGQPAGGGKAVDAPSDTRVKDFGSEALPKLNIQPRSDPASAAAAADGGDKPDADGATENRPLAEVPKEVEQLAEGVAAVPRGESDVLERKTEDFTDAPDFSLEQGPPGGTEPFGDQAGAKPAVAEVTDGEGRVANRAGDTQAKPAPAPAPTDGEAPGAPAATPDAGPANAQAQASRQQAHELARQANRKIIRNGDMSFEVDGFDSAVVQVNKIAAEEGGFVATTESEKLPNGKVKGSVVVRVPPERLDTLVLKLRGLGDLKNSRVAATDITKQFTDLEAQLRAAKTMEERLLEIIKTGKGEVKDLLEAEKQLGTWRERIETLEGEIRYYGNLVSLSTLTVTLVERDIRTSALLSESEQVNMGLEADDVEEARLAALKAIEEVKGRIVESDLKTHDAGQYAATIVAELSPDAAGQVIDRLKQIGRVARLEVQRRRATAEGTAPAPGARVERADTRLQLSIYNLANVAARNTTTLHLAAEDVEKAYRAILEQVTAATGRVVNSQLTKPTPEQTTGTVTFEAPAAAADVLLGAVRATGEVMRLESTTNPDTQNSTDAKRGFSVQIQSLATVPPRESTTLRFAARDVPAAFAALREAVRGANGRVLTSQLTEQDRTNVTGQLDFEVRREDYAAVDAALTSAGVVLSRNVNRSADAQNTVDSKVMLQVALVDERTVPPRETVTLSLAVDDVATKYEALLEALRSDAVGGTAGVRVLVSTINQQDPNNTTAQVEFDVRRTNRAAVDKALADAGAVYGRTVSRPAEGQVMLDDKVRLAVTLNDVDNLAPRETTTLGLEAADVMGVTGAVEAAALSYGGRKVDSDWGQDSSGRTVGRIVVDVPLAKAAELLRAAQREGRVLTVQRQQEPSAPEGPFARARLALTVATEDPIVQRDRGLGASIKSGLSTSVEWLLRSVTWIVVGLCLVAPWALILWVIWRIARNRRRGVGDGTSSSSSTPPPPASGPPAGGPVVSPA